MFVYKKVRFDNFGNQNLYVGDDFSLINYYGFKSEVYVSKTYITTYSVVKRLFFREKIKIFRKRNILSKVRF